MGYRNFPCRIFHRPMFALTSGANRKQKQNKIKLKQTNKEKDWSFISSLPYTVLEVLYIFK